MEQQDTSFLDRGLGVGSLIPTSYTNYGLPEGTNLGGFTPPERESFSRNLRNQLSSGGGGGTTQDFYVPKVYGSFSEQNGSPFYEYGNYSINDNYTRLNDGSFVKKYDFYKHGANNEELNAQLQDQGTSSVWGRGIKRFGNQIMTSFAGGLVSVPVGIVSAVSQGSLTALYDNDFTRWLDDVDAKSKANNGIYYSQAEKDMSLLGGATTKRFWADKVLGGAAFTVGTIGSEALLAVATGGSANVAKWGAKGFQTALRGAKMATEVAEKGGAVGKVMNKVNTALSKATNVADDALLSATQVGGAVASANNASRAAKMLNTGRFMLTSSGYEAGFEARQMKNDALASFEDYYRNLGREATLEERKAFNELSDEQSKNVAIANMAILSVSNMVMLGSMFNIPNPLKTLGFRQQGTSGNYLSKKLFGYGSKMIDGVEKSVSRNIFQKTLNGVYKIGQATATEGVWEEGGQGVASKWMQNYVEASYNPTKTQKSIDDVDSIWSPYLKEALAEQYGTKEGLEEVLIGGIIGSLFGVGNIVRSKEYSELDRRVVFNNSGREFSSEYAKNAVATKLGALNRNLSASNEMEDAIENEKPTEATLKAKEQLISKLDEAFTLGRDESFVGTMVADVQNMDSQQIMDTYGVSQEEVDTFKQNTIQEIQETAKMYSQNREFAENLAFSGRVPGLLEEGAPMKFVQAMSYTMTMGMSARKMAKESRDVLQQLFAESGDKKLSKNVDVLTLLSSVTEDVKNEISNIVKQTEDNKNRVEELTAKLRQLDNTRAQNENYLSERENIVSQLNEATLEEANLRAKADSMISLSSKNIFNDEYTITLNDILEGVNFDEFKNSINQYKTSSPQMYNSLSEALYTLEESTNLYTQFDALMREFASEDIKIKSFRGGLFSNISDEDVNEKTYNLLQKLSDTNAISRRGVDEVLDENQYVTSEEYSNFLKQDDQSVLPQNILNKISNKILSGEQLTRLEAFLNETRREEIDSYINEQKVDEVIEKVENNEPLTRAEQNVYEQNEQIIEEILDDPLQYSNGEDIEPDVQEEEEVSTEEKSKKIPTEFENVLGASGEIISPTEVEKLRELKKKTPNKQNKRDELEKALSKKTPPKVKIAKLNKQIKNMRTEQEEEEMKTLEEKMYNYNVADGSEFDGWNVLDYINYINSEESFTETQEEVKNGFTDEEVIRDASSFETKEEKAFEESEEANMFPAITQVTSNVFVSFSKDVAKIHHIVFEDLVSLIKSRNPNVQVLGENGEEIESFNLFNGIAGATVTVREIKEDGSIEDFVLRIPTYANGKNKGQISGKPIQLESETPYEDLQYLTGINIRNIGALKTQYYPAYIQDENGNEEILQSSDAFDVEGFDAESASRLENGSEVEFVISDSPFNRKIGGKTVDDDKDAENARHEEALEEFKNDLADAKNLDNVENVQKVLKDLFEKGKVKFSKLYEGLGRLAQIQEEYQNYLNSVGRLEDLKGKKVLAATDRAMFMPSNFSKRFSIVKENGKSPKTGKKTTAIKAKVGNFVNLETGKFFTMAEVDNILINEAIKAIPKVEKPSAKQLELVARDMFINNEVEISEIHVDRLTEFMPSTIASNLVEEKIAQEHKRHTSIMESLNKRKERGSASKEFNALAEILVVVKGTNKVVGRLKASYNLSDKLADLREYMTREFVQKGEEVRVASSVVKTFLGHPITKVENGVVKQYDATDSYSIRGVINNGEISATEEMDGVVTAFIDNISNQYKDVDIPFIVFTDKISGKRVAYPATIENETVDGAIDEVLDIVDQNLPPLQTAVKINEILFNWGVNDVRLTKDNILSDGIIESIIERLQNGQETFNVEKFLSEKPKAVYTTVDINGQAFLIPKSVISLDVPLEISETTIEEVEVEVNKEAVKEAKNEVKNQCGTQLSLF